MKSETVGRFARWLARELRAMFPVWLFFYLMFSLLRLNQTVILEEYRIVRTSPSLVLVGSLIVAKVFLIAEKLPFVKRFEGRKPLIYATVWKTFIYYLGCMLFLVIERIPGIIGLHETFRVALLGISHELFSSRFLVIQLWLVVLLLAFAATRELDRSLGEGRLKEMFFGQKPSIRKRSSEDRAA